MPLEVGLRPSAAGNWERCLELEFEKVSREEGDPLGMAGTGHSNLKVLLGQRIVELDSEKRAGDQDRDWAEELLKAEDMELRLDLGMDRRLDLGAIPAPCIEDLADVLDFQIGHKRLLRQRGPGKSLGEELREDDRRLELVPSKGRPVVTATGQRME